MWLATRENGRMLSFSTTKANNDFLDPHPVYVLDASPEAVERYVEAVAGAIGEWETNRYGRRVHIAEVTPLLARADVSALLRTRKR